VKRRTFIAGLASATAWSWAARAQQGGQVRRLGVLLATSESDPMGQARIAAFRQALARLGWTEGSNLNIEWRWTGGDIERVRDYASELVRLAPDVIIANGTPAVAALKDATTTIPIVFTVVNDPVAQGFIASMARPGGNITGFSFLEYSMYGKSLQVLKQIAPGIVRAALMYNADTYNYVATNLRSFETVAKLLSIELAGAPLHNPADIEDVAAKLAQRPGSALLVTPDPFLNAHRGTVIRAANQGRVPATYSYRQHVQEGGLTSYGPDSVEIFARTASYVDRILKGAKPADLPAEAPIKFELAINLKTAKALGLTIPETLLATADEVIQ
jgi:putative tryptophan/tyrosine transport system substrate-binding protein